MISRASRPCPDCGSPNPLDATACAECNHPLSPLASPEPPAPEDGAPAGEGDALAAGAGAQAPEEPSSGSPAQPRRRRPRPAASGGGLLGSGGVTEGPGKIIPRRRHQRVTFFGIGGTGPEVPGGAPSWIWFAVAGAALVIAVVAAIGITSQKPPFALPNGTPEQARRADSLAHAIDRDSLDLAANVWLGNLLYDTGNFDRAVPYYRRALALQPDQPDVRVDLATSLHQSGHSPEAIAELQQVIAAHPGHALARFNLGIIFESLGRVADAEATYRALGELPLSESLRAELAQRLAHLEHMRQAPTPPPAGR